MRFLIDDPSLAYWIAAGIAVCSALVWRRCAGLARSLAVATVGLWAVYGWWEHKVPSTGEQIRVDLLLIYPALGILTVLTAVGLAASRSLDNQDQ